MTTNLTFAARGTILHTRTTPGVSIVSFPGPAQLSIAFSMEKRGEPGIFSHVWAWCNLKVCRTNRLRFMYFQPTTCSMLGVYNSRPLIARYMRYATRTLTLFCCFGPVCPCTIKLFPPSFLSWHHSHEKRYQALSHSSVLKWQKAGRGLGTRPGVSTDCKQVLKFRDSGHTWADDHQSASPLHWFC